MPTWSKARVQTYSVNECTMHDGCGEIVDSYRDICGDPSLVAGGEGELSHPRHLGDVGEEHDQELGAHQSKHDQARNSVMSCRYS